MQVADFKDLIKNLPYLNQSFDIKKAIWGKHITSNQLSNIFGDSDILTISRNDLLECSKSTDIDTFIIKTLMWGYPSGGRGNNIKNILSKIEIEKLVKFIEGSKNSDINISYLKECCNNIKGMGLSTISKFTQFLDITIDSYAAVILDNRIIEAIKKGGFEEFTCFPEKKYNNAIKNYPQYIKIIDEIARKIAAKPDQVEMFLFLFGRNLKALE